MKPFACNNWVFIEFEKQEKTAGGIIIPEKTQKKAIPSRGKVFIAGSKCTQVQDGDYVMFVKRTEMIKEEIGESTFVVIPEEDVLSVLEREEPMESKEGFVQTFS